MVTDDFSGVFTPSMRAGRSRLRRNGLVIAQQMLPTRA
jgi:hypothetical protein